MKTPLNTCMANAIGWHLSDPRLVQQLLNCGTNQLCGSLRQPAHADLKYRWWLISEATHPRACLFASNC
jgi:hypothetical protein